jgi:hypothetical protein
MNKQEFAKVVQAWADGQKVEFRYLGSKSHGGWITEEDVPQWDSELEYRIKSKDITTMRFAYVRPDSFESSNMQNDADNLKLVFTNNVLTYAEVLK